MMTTCKVKSGIDAAFSRPLRPVYIVTRHGYRKRCLSRSAALNNLAHYMTTHVFRLIGSGALVTSEAYWDVYAVTEH